MSGSFEFKIFAPNNQQAALIGSFADGKEMPMKKGEDGYFRTQVELEDGVYRYKFRVQSLKRLIDECHAKGIRVIMDGIYNHTDDKCPLLLIDRDYWFYHDMHYPDDPDNYWGPEFNYDNYDEKLGIKPAWEYIGDVVRFWIQEYHIDKIRYDAVRQLANWEFLHWITQEATKAAGSKPFYNIAEHIPEKPELVGADGPMEGCWHESFRIFVIENITGDTFDVERLKEVLDAKKQGYSNTTNVVNYLASHDLDHLMPEEGFRALDKEAAVGRAKLGAVLLMTAMGVPMLSMGEEFGEYTRQTPNQPNKINWSLLDHELNRDLWEYYKGLIKLRKGNRSLHTEKIEFFHEDTQAEVLAYSRWDENDSPVVVVANFSHKFLADYHIPNFPASGIWHEYTSNFEIEVGSEKMVISLPEYAARVFTLSS